MDQPTMHQGHPWPVTTKDGGANDEPRTDEEEPRIRSRNTCQATTKKKTNLWIKITLGTTIECVKPISKTHAKKTKTNKNNYAYMHT